MSRQAESNTISDATASAGQSRTRLIIRLICLVIALAALWPAAPNGRSLLLVPALSPFIAFSSLIATRTFHIVALPGLIIGVLVLLRHRLFCRWICPMGSCADSVSRLGEKSGCKSIRTPLLGRWILWITLGGAILGFPVLVWLDPLSIFADTFSIRHSSDPAFWIPAIGFLLILILSFVCPRIWCRRICPLGAFQDVLFLLHKFARSAKSTENQTNQKSDTKIHMARRTVLGLSAGAAWLYIIKRFRVKALPPLRPPGALAESQFTGICTRCGNCLRACPSNIIERDTNPNSLSGLFAPKLTFENGYCKEDCVICTKVCPSGAITRLSLKEKPTANIGLAQVDMNVCLLGEDRDCSACMRWCPYDAIQYVFSQDEYCLTPTIDPQKCNGCGACESVCPTKPKKAIVVKYRTTHNS